MLITDTTPKQDRSFEIKLNTNELGILSYCLHECIDRALISTNGIASDIAKSYK